MSNELSPELRPETLTIGYGYDPSTALGSAKPPLYLTSTYVYESAAQAKDIHRAFFDGETPSPGGRPSYIYSRLDHPNLAMIERRLAALDRAEEAAVFASGMAAISGLMLCFLSPGDTLVFNRPTYSGTDWMLHEHLPRFGIRTFGYGDGLDGASLQGAVDAAMAAGPVGLIMLETPANPTGVIADVALAASAADAIGERQGRRPLVSVDNTFLGPFLQSPLDLGADLCVTSLTKYCAGHSDLLAGGISGRSSLIAPLKRQRTFFGSALNAHDCWLLLRSFETLHLRTERACDNARALAHFLRDHPKVASVTWLGFQAESEPAKSVFARQCRAAGSTFSFEIKGGEAECFRLLDTLRVLRMAVSLGGAETLICHSATTTHYSVPADRRRDAGISDATLRLSVGLEHVEDLIGDLSRALDAV
jgi:cystathionine gamma-synthase/methionine-gamma-lyase